MYKKILGLLMAILFAFYNCIAASSSDALLITDLGTSAKMIGIGNIEGFDNSASIVFENPAGLYRLEGISVGVFATEIMHEVLFKNMSLAFKTDFGTFGLGYMSATIDDIPHTYETNTNRYDVSYYFGYESAIAKLCYQNSLSKEINYGFSLNYINNKLDTYRGSGMNIDAGLLFDFSPLEISFALKNIINSSELNYLNLNDNDYNETETIPFSAVLAGKYNLGDFSFLVQTKKVDHVEKMAFSYGLSYSPWILKCFSVRAGYKEYFIRNSVNNVYTLGIGLNLFNTSFDYAYEKSEHTSYDNNHYFSFSMNI